MNTYQTSTHKRVFSSRPIRPARMGLIALLGLVLTPAGAYGQTLTVDCDATVHLTTNATYDNFVVNSGGTLNIYSPVTLTLNGGGTSTVNGTINLLGAGSELKFTTYNHSVIGNGAIVGQHASAKIAIDGYTLINCITISGRLEITDGASTGIFINQGRVRADASGTLEISVDEVRDSSQGLWQSMHCDAILLFDSTIATMTAGNMDGDFELFAGIIRLDEPLTTDGRLMMSGGTLDVNQNTTMNADNNSLFCYICGGTIEVAAGKTFTHH